MQYLRVSLAMLMKNSAASCIFQFNRSVVLSIFISNFILNYHMSVLFWLDWEEMSTLQRPSCHE